MNANFGVVLGILDVCLMLLLPVGIFQAKVGGVTIALTTIRMF